MVSKASTKWLDKVGSPSPLKATWRTCSKSSGKWAYRGRCRSPPEEARA